MENTRCPAVVDGKECRLDLLLVEQDLDAETEIYECPLGHRKYVQFGEHKKKRCTALVNGKECGLELTVVNRETETATEVYECPLGHRAYVPVEPNVVEDSS
jgi:peptide subunit release factor 1 (eRF1)